MYCHSRGVSVLNDALASIFFKKNKHKKGLHKKNNILAGVSVLNNILASKMFIFLLDIICFYVTCLKKNIKQ